MAPKKKSPAKAPGGAPPSALPDGSGAPPKPVAQTGGAAAPPAKKGSAAEKKKADAKEEAMLLKVWSRWWAASAPTDAPQQMTGTLVKDLASGVVAIATLEQLTGAEIKHNKPKDDKPISRAKMVRLKRRARARAGLPERQEPRPPAAARGRPSRRAG